MNHGFRFSVIASGSAGNACYVEAGETRLLIDAGLSCREMERRLFEIGASPPSLDGIILTHEHQDHIRGAGPLARRYQIPLYLNARTWDSGRNALGRLPDPRLIETGASFSVNGLQIETFTKCHDAADPVGMVLSRDGIRIGIATDMGRSTRLAEEKLKGCHALILEFNHDLEMLDQGPYPLHLKRRIRGPDGHLYNQQGGELLKTLAHADLRVVVLAHLSQTNNDPEKASKEAGRVLAAAGLRSTALLVGSQDSPGPMVTV